MSETPRFYCDGYDAEMVKHPNGEYVRYDDYASALAAANEWAEKAEQNAKALGMIAALPIPTPEPPATGASPSDPPAQQESPQ